jgi:hypothetical protein
MGEPYEPHLKRCQGCGEDVEPEFYDKDTGYCFYCLNTEKKEG